MTNIDNPKCPKCGKDSPLLDYAVQYIKVPNKPIKIKVKCPKCGKLIA